MKLKLVLGVIGSLLLGCGDDAGSGGSGAAATGGGGEGSGASGSTGGSGAGGSGTGAAGAEGGGGAGGAAGCLELDGAPITIAAADLCVVASYQAPGLELLSYGTTPTWGRHGGPLTFVGDGIGISRSRWSLQDGALAAETLDLAVADLPADAFWGAQLNDLTVDNLDISVAAWSGQDFFNVGELVLANEAGNGQTNGTLTTGAFGLAVIGRRVLYTGLSAANGKANAVAGLYAADVDATGLEFESSELIDAFGLATGPVAVDSAGNAFAVMTDYDTGTQELRGYPAPAIAPGQSGATLGTTLATLEGYGDAMAVVGAEADLPGLVAFQPNAASGEHLDVVLQRFTADGTTVAASGEPATLLTLTTPDTNVTLMTDEQNRLWVGLSENGTATFYVLDRP
jgi:hypothetical protein